MNPWFYAFLLTLGILVLVFLEAGRELTRIQRALFSAIRGWQKTAERHQEACVYWRMSINELEAAYKRIEELEANDDSADAWKRG